jgi:hypothetical protein
MAVKLWKDCDIVSFEVEVPARGVTVIRNGRSTIVG